MTALSAEAQLPNLLPESYRTDFSVFLDTGNVWAVDYSDTVDETNTIRSAVGIGANVFTTIGPLSFIVAQSLTKSSKDETETIQFPIRNFILMKYLVKFFVVTFFLLICTHTFAEQKIVVLDLTYVILNQSKAGKGAQEFLKKTFNDNNKEIFRYRKSIKKRRKQDLLEKKNILSKEEYGKKMNITKKKKYRLPNAEEDQLLIKLQCKGLKQEKLY